MENAYDVVIIGAGAAAYSAAMYAVRYKLSAVAIGKLLGGTTTEAYMVENYPGFGEISGLDLMDKFRAHAEKFGAEIVSDEVTGVEKRGEIFAVKTKRGKELLGKTVIMAFGQERRKLNAKGEKEFSGKGVSYCATCDGYFFRDKTVGIVGGSDAATMGAVFLAGLAKKVYIIYRGSQLRGEQVWIDRAKESGNIEIVYGANVSEIYGGDSVGGVKLDTGNDIKLDGLFIEIGAEPDMELIEKFGVETDARGCVKVDASQKTSAEGIYAAGDISTGSNHFEQVVTAAAEGAIAAESINRYLKTR